MELAKACAEKMPALAMGVDGIEPIAESVEVGTVESGTADEGSACTGAPSVGWVVGGAAAAGAMAEGAIAAGATPVAAGAFESEDMCESTLSVCISR